MKTEIFEKIITGTKKLLGLDEKATEVEVHEALVNASDDIKADLIVSVANQIANFAAEEINRRADEVVALIKTDSETMINLLNVEIEELKAQINELKSNKTEGVSAEQFKTQVDEMYAAFGKEMNEIKALLNAPVPGAESEKIIETHKEKVSKTPIVATWGKLAVEN